MSLVCLLMVNSCYKSRATECQWSLPVVQGNFLPRNESCSGAFRELNSDHGLTPASRTFPEGNPGIFHPPIAMKSSRLVSFYLASIWDILPSCKSNSRVCLKSELRYSAFLNEIFPRFSIFGDFLVSL